MSATPIKTPEPWVTSARRTGTSPVERKALGKVQREIASMPASLVVQIALWPLKLSDLAREQKVSSSMIYNCLAGVKPYEPIRDMLAERLGVSRLAIDRLIDTPPPPPLSLVPPDPIPDLAETSESPRPPRPVSVTASVEKKDRRPRQRSDPDAQIKLEL